EILCNVEIGYCIGRKWWGKGLVAEAFSDLIRFFFEEVGAEKVCARHDVDNPASGRVMQKCGLKFEGVIRRELLVKEKPRDLAHYSILKDEYYSQKCN
ncbi:MAG: GNAT family N-acetyltransferase, partial [Oscillospiraceae bacterium]|nr:GNAT family N-acetyltransferase [Oscillospiraceae bacterium]